METALITVVETRSFEADAKKHLTADEKDAAIDYIAANPEAGDIMTGTGGVRKIRFALQGRGKRGGGRIVYYFYDRNNPVFLLALFSKNAKDNLTKAERNALAKLSARLIRLYARRGRTNGNL